MTITHQAVIGEDGKPAAAIIPYSQFVELVEIYGLDFTDEEKAAIREAQDDRSAGGDDAFVRLDEVERELGCTE